MPVVTAIGRPSLSWFARSANMLQTDLVRTNPEHHHLFRAMQRLTLHLPRSNTNR